MKQQYKKNLVVFHVAKFYIFIFYLSTFPPDTMIITN